MSPERRRWLVFVRACKSDLETITAAGLGRLGGRDAIVLTLDEMRDLGAMISICEHAAVMCDRLGCSLGDDDHDGPAQAEGRDPWNPMVSE